MNLVEIYLSTWKNKEGTEDRHCECGSWKQHWLNYSGCKVWPKKCAAYGCNGEATLGGHVISDHYSGEWIIPLCDSCNKRTDEFTLKDTPPPPKASANKSETCAR